MSQLYSIHALSLELGRDRGTVTRALRDVPPDGYDHDQPRWLLAKAVAALERRSYRPPRSTGRYIDDFAFRRPTRLDAIRSDYDTQLLALSEEKSAERKRELALAMAPTLDRYQVAFMEVARALNACDEIAIESRAGLIFTEQMEAVSGAAEWPRDSDFWVKMLEAMEAANGGERETGFSDVD